MLQSAINTSLQSKPTVAFNLLNATLNADGSINVKFALQGVYTNANICFSLISKTETTQLKRGENQGLTLTNENIVRQLININSITEGEINFNKTSVINKDNMAIVAFVQNKSNDAIIGASSINIKS